jgi:hypothetical protein
VAAYTVSLGGKRDQLEVIWKIDDDYNQVLARTDVHVSAERRISRPVKCFTAPIKSPDRRVWKYAISFQRTDNSSDASF